MPVVEVRVTERPAVIYYIIFIASWDFDHRVVTGSCSYFGILLKDFADTFNGPKGESAIAYATE